MTPHLKRPIKLVAVGWTAIRVLDRCMPGQAYIAAAVDAVVLRNSSATDKLLLWLDPVSKKWANTNVREGTSTSDRLGSFVEIDDVVIFVTGFGQDEEAGYLLDLVDEVRVAGGTTVIIGSQPQGKGYQTEQERADAQLSSLKEYGNKTITVAFDREYFLARAPADTAIIDLHQLVDSMLHQAVERTIRDIECFLPRKPTSCHLREDTRDL